MQHTEDHPPQLVPPVARRVHRLLPALCAVALLATVPVVASTGAAAATAVLIAQFPAQGPCTFTDTFGAVRPDGAHHQGVDIIATVGRKVYAVNDGTLTVQYVVAPNQLLGNGWRLTRGDGTYFLYSHLSTFATGLTVGSKVKAGQILGAVGDTGNAGTPHLHFEVHPAGGAAIDPTPVVQRVNGCSTSVVPPQPSTTTTTTTTVPAPPAIDQWTFVTPVTALDTTGRARLAAGSATTVKVNALAGVPSTTKGVMVRAIVRNMGGSGFIVVKPCGTTTKAASLVFSPGRLAATTTLVKVTNGAICVTTSVIIDLRLDVVGYVGTTGSGLRPVAARRALDTRRSAPLAAGATIAATGAALGVTAGDRAVTVTVSLLNATVAGSFGIGPCGGTPWIVPYPKASLQVFSAVVRTSGSDVCMSSTQTVQVVVDVTAVWTAGGGVTPSGPTRLYDSRTAGPITTTSVKLPVSLPTGMRRAQLSITLVGAKDVGVLFGWSCSLGKPVASLGAVAPSSFTTVVMAYDATHGGLCVATNGSFHITVDVAAMG